ncbi:IS1 family transposase [Telluribacter sp.]|uniref:IS1 family transposase n=1 Tax=Telluribacter sp. TaxID=1978767 RepID=UPI0039C8C40F
MKCTGPPSRSFVGSKQIKTWIWLAFERRSGQIVGLATGDRSEYCGQLLWESLPFYYQQNAIFFTDLYPVYKSVIPAQRHHQKAGGTAHIERFNRGGGPQYSQATPAASDSENISICQNG